MDKIILGTMNISYKHSSLNGKDNENKFAEYSKIIKTYKGSSCAPILDTAYYYGNTECEKILGDILETEVVEKPLIATKANPWFENDFTNGKLGGLSSFHLERQLTESLKNLKQDSVDTFFLHCPDHETPIKETLETVTTLWRKDKFNRFGISNFNANDLNNLLELSEKEGFVKPLCYQGMYNVLCRKVEEVFPILDQHDMDFWAYNPLAGGLLTGKYRDIPFHSLNSLNEGSSNDSRFKNNKIYQNIFWKEEILKGVNTFLDINPEIPPIKKAFDWLIYYSALRQDDKIVIGVSTVEHLDDVLKSVDSGCKLTRDNAFELNESYISFEHCTPDYHY
jgi:aflatoxin B1 aldehyde reductase